VKRLPIIPAAINEQAAQFTAARRGWSGPIGMSMIDSDEGESGDTEGAEQSATLPTAEDLAGMTPEEVQAALDNAHEEAATIRETDPADMSDEQVDRLEALAEFTETVATDSDRRAQEAADRQARVDAANERLDAGSGDGEGGDGEEADGDGADGGEGDGAEGEGDAGDGEGSQSIAAAAGRPAPAAPARRPSPVRQALRSSRRQDPRPAPEGSDSNPLVSIVAAAEGTGFSGGQHLPDMAAVARAFTRRAAAFPHGKKASFAPLPVVTIERNFEAREDGLYVGNPDFADEFMVASAAARESRLPGGSLSAAVALRERARASDQGLQSLGAAGGGWCAPSTTQYGLCAAETLDGIAEVPEVGVPRGGLNFTEGPDFVDIFTDAGFSQTEAEAIAGETKDCVEITCPDFDEVRLDAVGICVRAPLLTRAAYPELIERWVSGTVIANAHKVGARVVAQIATLLGASPSFTLTGTPTTWGLTSALEFIVEQERIKRRLSRNETWEVMLPHWAPAAIRADLANRESVAAESITRAQVMQHFTDRMLAPQFVYGLQDLGPSAVAYPTTMDALVYPAGTFVKGTQDVISLDTVYDNPSLTENMYTAAFVEDGVLVAKMCPGGRKITVPNLPSGRMGALDLNDPWGSVQS
jgi:hypothetical protein